MENNKKLYPHTVNLRLKADKTVTTSVQFLADVPIYVNFCGGTHSQNSGKYHDGEYIIGKNQEKKIKELFGLEDFWEIYLVKTEKGLFCLDLKESFQVV
jgi:hypothetical protein